MNHGSPTRLVLIAGPSGSGKSRLAKAARLTCLRLDDYYHDADFAGMPTTSLGITDWDDPRSWDAEAALAGLQQLLATSNLDAPTYSISQSRRVGSHRLHLGPDDCLVAEGIFAIEFLAYCRRAKIAAEAIYLDRPPVAVYALRLRRDLAKKRKPPLIAIRRGWALARAQSALRSKAMTAGFEPLTMRQALTRVRQLRNCEHSEP